MLWRELGEDEFNLKSTSTKEKRWRHFVLRAGQRLDELSLLFLPASACIRLPPPPPRSGPQHRPSPFSAAFP